MVNWARNADGVQVGVLLTTAKGGGVRVSMRSRSEKIDVGRVCMTLGGGGHPGALLHIARTVCRRAERQVVGLAEKVDVHPNVIVYLNRLSDFLFVMARLVNHREGKQEILW